MNRLTEEQLNAYLKFAIGITFCAILGMMATLSMYSVVFVTQPMSGMAPADKQFFLLLSDMSKYILGALATLIAVKGKEALHSLVSQLAGSWQGYLNLSPQALAAKHMESMSIMFLTVFKSNGSSVNALSHSQNIAFIS